MTVSRLTTNEIRSRGRRALIRELGPHGYVEFLRQYVPGRGDFTAERQALSGALSIDEVIDRARKRSPGGQGPNNA